MTHERPRATETGGTSVGSAMYHRTCRDAAASIDRMGMLVPHWHPLLDVRLVWLSDRPDRSRASLGLTSGALICDRMEVLYRLLSPRSVFRWSEWAKARGIPAGVLRSGDPRAWWVSEEPQTVVRVWPTPF